MRPVLFKVYALNTGGTEKWEFGVSAPRGPPHLQSAQSARSIIGSDSNDETYALNPDATGSLLAKVR